MAKGQTTIQIPGELESAALDGRVVSAEGIYDYNLDKNLEQINLDNEEKIDSINLIKVDKIVGKGLSTEDYTTSEKNKLLGLPSNDALQSALNLKADKTEVTLLANGITLNRQSDLVYSLLVNGTNKGTINIPKDLFLKSVTYSNHIIHFVFETTSGEATSDIDVTDLIDTYTAGNGLQLSNDLFSIKLDGTSEEYITIGADGVKISGIKPKFDKIDDNLTLNVPEFDSTSEAGDIVWSGDKELGKIYKIIPENIDFTKEYNEGDLVAINGNYYEFPKVYDSFEDWYNSLSDITFMTENGATYIGKSIPPRRSYPGMDPSNKYIFRSHPTYYAFAYFSINIANFTHAFTYAKLNIGDYSVIIGDTSYGPDSRDRDAYYCGHLSENFVIKFGDWYYVVYTEYNNNREMHGTVYLFYQYPDVEPEELPNISYSTENIRSGGYFYRFPSNEAGPFLYSQEYIGLGTALKTETSLDSITPRFAALDSSNIDKVLTLIQESDFNTELVPTSITKEFIDFKDEIDVKLATEINNAKDEITDIIEDNELVISSALNDLNARLIELDNRVKELENNV